jgi:uncharacterized protein (TIGR02246 family)
MAQSNVSDDSMTVARGIYEKSVRLWNEEGKTDSDPSMYTEDADLINAFGPRWHGRKEIVANTLTVASSARPKLSYELVSATAIVPDTILAIGVGIAEVPADRPNAGRHEMSQTMLLVKHGQDWKIRFFQSTPIVRR